MKKKVIKKAAKKAVKKPAAKKKTAKKPAVVDPTKGFLSKANLIKALAKFPDDAVIDIGIEHTDKVDELSCPITSIFMNGPYIQIMTESTVKRFRAKERSQGIKATKKVAKKPAAKKKLRKKAAKKPAKKLTEIFKELVQSSSEHT